MSPEQARGRPADKRSDVWAFGCVLYEMLTGKRAFPGGEVMDTLAAVMRAEPDFAALPAGVPREIRTLVERCLVKDRRARVSDIAVARYALDSPDTPAVPASPAPTRSLWPWAFAALAATIAIAAAAIPRLATTIAEPAPVIRATISTPGATTFGFATIAVSRQGTAVAYPSTQGRILLRRLSDSEARPLQGTEAGANPFFSPDGEWLGFFADGKLKKISIAGGAAQVLADAPLGRGGTWSRDGTIVFAPESNGGLLKVSSEGGAVEVLTRLAANERAHRWPHVLPDGRTVLFTIQREGRLYDDGVIAAVRMSGGAPQVVVEGGSSPQYADSGHLIYGRSGALLAVPFDPVAVRAGGAAVSVIDNARTNTLNGATPAAVSANGLLVYRAGTSGAGMTLMAANRNGQSQALLSGRLFDDRVALSPDGRQAAFAVNDGQSDLWVIDLTSRQLRRMTFGSGAEASPVWSPDGKRLYYSTNTGGTTRTVQKAVDGSDAETQVTPIAFFPMSISPDGKTLAGRAIVVNNSSEVTTVDLASKKTSAATSSPANETAPSFSPDGRLVAYQSDESGINEVFVQQFPSGSRWQVTTGGGSQPRWASGGREIVYRNGSTIFAVPVTLRPFSTGTPQTLFSTPNLFAFDITADGKSLVALQAGESPDNPNLVLVSSWFEELKAKVRPAR
jgi:serine/threonine-protein kinase